MSTPTNHWKLGLFVVVAGGCAFAALVLLGSQSFRHETVHYVSYFDEPVTGLDIGSPVNFRGVRIGNVDDIDIAPDRRHVEVGYQLEVRLLVNMGLARKRQRHVQLNVPRDVRVQIASTGVTGVKHIKLDFFPNVPIPELRFPVPENYIPASPSTLKNLEDSVTKALDQLPAVVERALSVLSRTDAVLAELQTERLPQKAASLLSHADQSVGILEAKLAGVDTIGLSRQGNQALSQLNQVLARADGMLQRMDGEAGLLGSVQRATDAMGDVAVNARGTAPKLDRTLEHVSDVAISMQRLLDALERDPDMLIKGRARSEP